MASVSEHTQDWRIRAPAIVILGPGALHSALQLRKALPDATIHALAKRFDTDMGAGASACLPTDETRQAAEAGFVDFVSIDDLGAHLRACYLAGTPIIALCAAGIVIRCLASVIGAAAKTDEPAVLAVAEDGSAVVPLVGGLSGANELARRVAHVFSVAPAITTSGELRFGRCLLSPPPGYALSDLETGKRFVSDLLSGAPARLDGEAPWLADLGLEQVQAGTESGTDSDVRRAVSDEARTDIRTIRVGIERTAPEGTLLIHPRSVIVDIVAPGEALLEVIQETLRESNIAEAAVAALRCPVQWLGDDRISVAGDLLRVPVRYVEAADDRPLAATADAGADTPVDMRVNTQKQAAEKAPDTSLDPLLASALSDSRARVRLDIAMSPMPPDLLGMARGTLTVVGLGPGSKTMLAPAAAEALRQASDILGYTTYVDMAGPFAPWQRLHGSDNREELARARHALALAANGQDVVIVSSGDPGVFAMASAVMEVLAPREQTRTGTAATRADAWHAVASYGAAYATAQSASYEAAGLSASAPPYTAHATPHASGAQTNPATSATSATSATPEIPGATGQDAGAAADEERTLARWRQVRLRVIPGISAAFATAAAAGAPLGHDCCLISLSDNLKPWPVIEQRLELAGRADLVLAFYNPISRARPWQLDRAFDILRAIRDPRTPVILGRDIGRPDERLVFETLGTVRADQVDMRTMVIVGSSTTRRLRLGTREWAYTPRWYPDSDLSNSDRTLADRPDGMQDGNKRIGSDETPD